MKPKTYFKINSIEELKQAYKKYKDRWIKGWEFEQEKKYFTKLGYRYIVCNSYSKIGLYITIHEPTQLTEVPNPFTEVDCEEVEPEFPCEMYVWDDHEEQAERKTIYGMFQNQYMTQSKYGIFFSYKHAKPIKKEAWNWKIQDIKTKQDAISFLKQWYNDDVPNYPLRQAIKLILDL